MFLSLLQFFATKFLVLALHLESGSFPRPLSARIAKHHSVFSPPCRRRLMDAASSFLLSIQS